MRGLHAYDREYTATLDVVCGVAESDMANAQPMSARSCTLQVGRRRVFGLAFSTRTGLHSPPRVCVQLSSSSHWPITFLPPTYGVTYMRDSFSLVCVSCSWCEYTSYNNSLYD